MTPEVSQKRSALPNPAPAHLGQTKSDDMKGSDPHATFFILLLHIDDLPSTQISSAAFLPRAAAWDPYPVLAREKHCLHYVPVNSPKA